jgi:ribonuclease VapC
MVIDSSAIIAVLFQEPEAAAFEACLVAARTRQISAVSRVELSFVIEGRKGQAGRRDLDELLLSLDPVIVAVTSRQADLAIEAFRRFGKGRHKAGLNIGDCFSYALARESNQTLLFKGDDFSHTDIKSALPEQIFSQPAEISSEFLEDLTHRENSHLEH